MHEDSRADKAKQSALRFLALRDRSEKELRKKLAGKGFGDDLIDPLLADFRELGYINDETFTVRQVRYLARDKLYGNRRIEAYLLEKGFSREGIRQAIAGIREEFPEKEALQIVLSKKLKGQPIKNDAGEKRRLAQSMMGKGFPPKLIYTMLEEHRNDNDGK